MKTTCVLPFARKVRSCRAWAGEPPPQSTRTSKRGAPFSSRRNFLVFSSKSGELRFATKSSTPRGRSSSHSARTETWQPSRSAAATTVPVSPRPPPEITSTFLKEVVWLHFSRDGSVRGSKEMESWRAPPMTCFVAEVSCEEPRFMSWIAIFLTQGRRCLSVLSFRCMRLRRGVTARRRSPPA